MRPLRVPGLHKNSRAYRSAASVGHMVRLALVCAFGAMLAAGLPSPGLYLAIGLGLAAIGSGWLGYRRKNAPGAPRLASAAAMAVGVLGVVLGSVRVVMVLAALDRIDRMLG
jgi:hypothetical protein